MGEGQWSRREAKARGERPGPPRARALTASSSRGRFRSPASPPPPLGSRRARAFTALPPGNGSRRCLRSGTRTLSARPGPRAFRFLLFRTFSPLVGAAGIRVLGPVPPRGILRSVLAPPKVCGPAQSLQDCGAPRRPLCLSSRPKIGPGGSAGAGRALN